MAELLWTETEGVLVGRFVVSGPMSEDEVDRIGRQLLESPDKSNGKIVLDFQEVTFIHSLFLAKLIALQKKCEGSKSELRLCNVGPLIMEVIEVSRLNKFFAVYPSEQEAIADF
jgi:anti-anti-sigma factor